MRLRLGQAARWLAWLLQHVVQFALAGFILAIILIGALAVRLSQGPLEIPWIAHRLEAAATADGPTRLAIGRAELAWEGWRLGLDRPLDLRLTDIAAIDPSGNRIARLPRAELSVSAGWLLLGRLVPRALEVDGARLRVFRASDGTVALDLGSLGNAKATNDADDASAADDPGSGGLSAILHDFTHPAQDDADARRAKSSRWQQLRRVRIHDAAIVVADRQLGLFWRVPHLEVDLRRRLQGGVEGEGHADIEIGGQTLALALRATLQGDAAATTTVRGEIAAFVPARLAAISPSLAALAALDAPVTVVAAATLGADLLPSAGELHLHADAGQARVNQRVVLVQGADLDARVGEGRVEATLARLDLVPRPDGPRTRLSGAMRGTREGDHLAVSADVALDQVTAGDLPALWPEGVGGPGTRPWIVRNITAGVVHDARFSVVLAVPPDLSDVALTSVSGGFSAQDLTVHWLRPVPPIEHGDARLAFAGPDVIEIAVLSGREAGGGLVVRGGKVRLTGIAGKDQFADIEADLAGPLPDLLALLRHPKIKLLDRRPIEMRNPAGRLAGKLTVDHLPLKDNVALDDLQIHAATHLTDVHLGGIAAGHDLDRGALDLDAGNDGLHVRGLGAARGHPLPAHR